MLSSRRDLLSRTVTLLGLMTSSGLLPAGAQAAAWNRVAFDAKTPGEAAKALGGLSLVPSSQVILDGPEIWDDGSAVQVGISTTLPGVRRLAILVEKNPSPLAGLFEISDAVEASIQTRIKMSESSNVFAVAMMNDGKALFAVKEIKVTLGGCGA